MPKKSRPNGQKNKRDTSDDETENVHNNNNNNNNNEEDDNSNVPNNNVTMIDNFANSNASLVSQMISNANSTSLNAKQTNGTHNLVDKK